MKIERGIFPRNLISNQDVIQKVLSNTNIPFVRKLYEEYSKDSDKLERILEIVGLPISPSFTQKLKLESLLKLSVKDFNTVVFAFLKTTDYPLSKADTFPLIENEDVIIREEVFRILRESGVGVPAYYEKREYQVEIDGKVETGYYSRSRSGCFFCFFQQKIEWVWLYENHTELYKKAMVYEKDGYTWQQGETLEELAHPDRRKKIKREHFTRMKRNKANTQSQYLLDILDDAESEGCAACFI